MPKSYLVTAVAFLGDSRPTRSGLYLRRIAGGGIEDGSFTWSYFTARTKVWGCWSFLSEPRGAYEARTEPSFYQRLPWYALPLQIPSGARIERVSGLTFRVTET